MAEAAGPLKPLSCMRCKKRKVRCSRLTPKCDRCKAQDLECIYPVRQRRRTPDAVADGTTIIDCGAISTILGRLQRVEEHCVALPPRTSVALPASTASAASAALLLPDQSAITPLPVSPSSAATPSSAVDATATLKHAVDQVQRLKLQGYAQAVISEPIDIPLDLAKSCVHNYFAQRPTDAFLSLIDRRVIESIPDILGLPHIHLDSCIVVIYYAILWHGCDILTGRGTPRSDLLKYHQVGARVSSEGFDYEMTWQMYKRACEYAQDLNMHNLDDGDGGMGICNPNISDDDRKAFWSLIEADAFFRLVFNKPPCITDNGWKVNLPWLDLSRQQAPQPTTTTVFVVGSKITLLLLRFFAMFNEEANDISQIMPKTEEMCLELKCLYEEYNLSEWAKDKRVDDLDAWMIADIALSGYSCIIFMLHRAVTLEMGSAQPITTDTDVPDLYIALDAATHIVGIICYYLEKYPNSATLSATFGAYRAYVPLACLIGHILRAPDVSAYARDIGNLNRLGRVVTVISHAEKDFIPLARAIRNLNVEVRKKADACGKTSC